MNDRSEHIRAHFDSLAPDFSKWKRRNKYYHQDQKDYFRYLVSENKRILDLGCGNGDLLHALKPSSGTGIDISPAMRVTTNPTKYRLFT